MARPLRACLLAAATLAAGASSASAAEPVFGVPVYCDAGDAGARPFFRAADGIHLPAGYCRILRGREVDWVTAYVTWNLAHELGHALDPCADDGSVDCEARADCWAAGNVARVAGVTGRTPRQTRFIVRSAREGMGFGYLPVPATCWLGKT